MSIVISEEMERLLATGSTLRAMFEEGKKMRKFIEDLRYELEDPQKHAFTMTFLYAIMLILAEALTPLLLEAALMGINTGSEELDLFIGKLLGGAIAIVILVALVVSFGWWFVQLLRDIKLTLEGGWRW